jgi:hypothetical protein
MLTVFALPENEISPPIFRIERWTANGWQNSREASWEGTGLGEFGFRPGKVIEFALSSMFGTFNRLDRRPFRVGLPFGSRDGGTNRIAWSDRIEMP